MFRESDSQRKKKGKESGNQRNEDDEVKKEVGQDLLNTP